MEIDGVVGDKVSCMAVCHSGNIVCCMNKATVVNTRISDRLHVGMPPRYVIKQTRSAQPCIAKSSTSFCWLR